MPTEPSHIAARAKKLSAPLSTSLTHVGHVRRARGAVAITGAAFGIVMFCSVGVPAYAQVAQQVLASGSQSLIVSAEVPAAAVTRDAYTVTTPPPLEWPVDPSSPIASPFGARTAPCDGCSSFHEGVDFDAGYGAQVHAIAAGVVVETDNPNWSSLGVHVAIQHLIDGQVITSAYGHMETGSMTLHVGDTVYPGEVIGLVGSTGASTGPHLHFEIRLNGADPVNPLPWMHAKLG